jgi:hypothetical protein
MNDGPNLELEDEEPGGVDSGWEDESSESVDEPTSASSVDSSLDEGDKDAKGVSNTEGEGIDVGEVQPDGDIANILEEHGSEDLLTVPGTDYGDFPYALKRTGSSEKRHYDRDVSVNFKIFDGTHQQLVALEAYLNEVVYPDQKIIRTDIFNAAMLVGIYNPEQIIQVLDAWGFGHLSDSN